MTRRSVFSSLLVGATALKAFAQDQKKRLSPHDTVSLDMGAKNISITYGRPYLKGRNVGQEIAPFGKVWRLGADEATKLTVTSGCKLGSLDLAAGSYALFAIPQTDKWTMIVNKVADQWGAFDYDQSKDLGRFTLDARKPASSVEQFTIALTKQSASAANLSLTWGDQQVSTTIQIS